MAVELGIPKDLEKAAGIAADPDSPTRQVDVGLLGESYFLLRVGDRLRGAQGSLR